MVPSPKVIKSLLVNATAWGKPVAVSVLATDPVPVKVTTTSLPASPVTVTTPAD